MSGDPRASITSSRLIGIARKLPADAVVDIVAAAASAGLEVVEVTLDSEDPLSQIARLRDAFPDMAVGAGSVLDPSAARAALDAGAQFVVSPAVDPDVVGVALERGAGCLPGAATPTEILTAVRAGATAVKVFPAAQLGGADFLRAVMSPLGDPPLVPTGGVTPATAPGLLAAGAVAVGAGSALFSTAAFREGGLDEIARRAAEWVEAVR